MLQERITALARHHGMRVLGPNCLGMVYFRNAVMATFSDIVEMEIGTVGTPVSSRRAGPMGRRLSSRPPATGWIQHFHQCGQRGRRGLLRRAHVSARRRQYAPRRSLPGRYDNNKLLFIAFLYACGLVAGWLFDAKDRLTRGAARNRLSTRPLLGYGLRGALFLSGALTLGREYVSDYQLIDADQVSAADYVKENAAPDATFLTYNNHNNCIAALTGRNIVCGSGSYLYFHGIDYSARENAPHLLYEQPSGAGVTVE